MIIPARSIFSTVLICALLFCPGIAGARQDSSHKNGSPITRTGLQTLIRERHGRPLLLNFWATWCQPCVEEFPALVQIRRIYADTLVDVVGISVDYPDEAESRVLPFLRDHHVNFPVYIADMKKQDEFINAVEPSWSGAVPATFIFDTGGRRRAFLLGRKTFASFKAHLDSAFVAR